MMHDIYGGTKVVCVYDSAKKNEELKKIERLICGLEHGIGALA
jgi:hypothetical protein